MGLGLLLLRRTLLGSPEGTDGTLLASQGIVCYTVKTQSKFARQICSASVKVCRLALWRQDFDESTRRGNAVAFVRCTRVPLAPPHTSIKITTNRRKRL